MASLVLDNLNLFDYWKRDLTNIVGLLDVLITGLMRNGTDI
jgi:hypothetical protein